MAWPPLSWEDTVADAAAFGGMRATTRRGAAVAREMLQTIVLALVLFSGTRAVLQNFIVENVSMEPTLIGGQHIWVDKVLYRLTDGPHRGDIVVFQSWDQDLPFVKRVVGLPGETVEFREGGVLIDGEPIDEPYLAVPTDGPAGPFALGSDELFVMGDNRSRSGDSRLYGPLRAEDLIGRAWMRYWPPDEIGLLSGSTRPLFASDPR